MRAFQILLCRKKKTKTFPYFRLSHVFRARMGHKHSCLLRLFPCVCRTRIHIDTQHDVCVISLLGPIRTRCCLLLAKDTQSLGDAPVFSFISLYSLLQFYDYFYCSPPLALSFTLLALSFCVSILAQLALISLETLQSFAGEYS